MLKKTVIILLIVFLFAATWSIYKSIDNLVAFYQLLFLFVTIVPILFLAFDKGIEFLQNALSKYPLVKFGLFCIIILWGYNLTTGFNKILPTINFGHTFSTGLIEFFIIEVPLLGVFLPLYFINAIANIKNRNTNILLFLFILLFALFGGALWSDSGIFYDQTIKSLAFFPHFNYHILFFILLPLVIFIRNYDIKKLGFSFDIKNKDLIYFVIGILTIFFVHCAVRMSVGAFQIPNLSLSKWVFKVAYIGFIIALPEELLIRGIGISVLEEKFNHRSNKAMIAIILTSILEGLLHYRLNIFVMVFTTLSGFMYGYLFIKTRKLIAPVLTHTLVDTLFAPFPF